MFQRQRPRPDGELTERQQRFARERGGILGARAEICGGSVFVYRDEGWRTCRWLVDPSGEIVDFVSLHRPSGGDVDASLAAIR